MEEVPQYWNNLSLENIVYTDPDGIEMEEEWRPVVGYEGLYEISCLGRVKSLNRLVNTTKVTPYRVKEKILKQNISTGGYVLVSLSNGSGNIIKIRIHQLVGQSFIPNIDNKPELNHKKGIKTDNRHFQLEWNTEKENMNHAVKTGLRKIGEKCKSAKLKANEVLFIFASTEKTSALSAMYNVSDSAIDFIRSGRNWSHLTGKIHPSNNKK